MSTDMSLFVLPQVMAQIAPTEAQLESTAPLPGVTHSRTVSSDTAGGITVMPPPSTAAEYSYPHPGSNAHWSFPSMPQPPSLPIDFTVPPAPAGLASSPDPAQTPLTAAFPFATTAPPNTPAPTFTLGASSPWTPSSVTLSKTMGASPSELLGGWSIPSPYNAAVSATSPSPRRPPGPIRGFSTSAIYPRKRTSIVSGFVQPATSLSPATPNMAFTPFTPAQAGAYPYPYTPPGHTHPAVEPQTPLHRRPSAPVLHPSPYSTLQTSPNTGGILDKTATDPRNVHASGGFRRLHPSPNGSAEFENVRDVQAEADKKAPRFKPSKDQLDILIAAYEENKWVGTFYCHEATKRPSDRAHAATYPLSQCCPCRRDVVSL